jgi:hypothetical protein
VFCGVSLLTEQRSHLPCPKGSCNGRSLRTHVTRLGQDYIPRIMPASGGAQHPTETEVTHRNFGIPEGPRRPCVSAFDFLHSG